MELIAERFEVVDFIAQGGMGAVYRGLDRQTDQTVAIKRIRSELVDVTLINRFQQEGETLRKLNHPNIVKLIATAQQNDQHYMIMEYVSGGSLADLLAKQSRLSADQTVSIALELADALARAHHLKIIHRDLKPANVLLADDGTPRLTDFGVAHAAQSHLTATGVIVGTLGYLAPETLNGESVDARTDIWALGVMLFELLTGRLPFHGDSPSALIIAILTQSTPDLEALQPDIPAALVDLIYRMLDKDPRQRIGSMRMIAAELEAIFNNGPDTARLSRSQSSIDDSESRILQFPAPTPIRDNFPVQTTPFVGREAELTELSRMIADPATRLITILGPGGMGKTRLSLEVANEQLSRFSKNVFFVPLAALTAPESIISAIAEAVHFDLYQTRDPRQQLIDYFHNKTTLLVLDNFEHLLAGATLISEILQAAPAVKVIVTSRVKLNLQEETLFRIEGMDFSDWETPEDALEYSAVKLFLQSAHRVQPDYTLNPNDLLYLARICRQVQGMPLGILLAAAWVDMLSLAEISQEIARSTDFLETEVQNVPTRQRSIRAVFEYSWNLLLADERDVFARLSVFRGGFTREAGQKVTGASLRTLAALVNKSMLRRVPDGRYEIHELLRQYAEERLSTSPEISEAAHQQWCNYFIEFITGIYERSKMKSEKAALDETESEIANLSAVWRYLVSQHKTAMLDKCYQFYQEFYETRAHLIEMLDLLNNAVENLTPPAPQDLLAYAGLLNGQAHFLIDVGSPDKGRICSEKVIAIYRRDSDLSHVIYSLCILAHACVRTGEFEDGIRAAQEALALARELADQPTLSDALFWLSILMTFNGELLQAKPIAQECLVLYQSLGNAGGEALVRCFALSGIAFGLGDYAEAEALYRQCLRFFEEIGFYANTAYMSRRLGKLAILRGNYDEAEQLLCRSLKLLVKIRVVWQVIDSVYYVAELRIAQGEKKSAVELLALINHHPSSLKPVQDLVTQAVAQLQEEISAETFAKAWERGRALQLDAVVRYLIANSDAMARGSA